jgi:hypothetical protein
MGCLEFYSPEPVFRVRSFPNHDWDFSRVGLSGNKAEPLPQPGQLCRLSLNHPPSSITLSINQ